MKHLIYTLSLSILCISCNNSGDIDPVQKIELEDWIRLEIPNGREARAVAGDIDNILLVATHTDAYYTNDGGKSWHFSEGFRSGIIRDMIERNDTVFTLITGGHKYFIGPPEITDHPFASTCYQYTTDYGKTWTQDLTGKYARLESPIGIAESSDGMMYRVKENKTLVPNSTTSFYFTPSNIQKYSTTQWLTLEFPLKHQFNNIHFDASDRLYIAASSGEFNENNLLMSPLPEDPALIYISKNPIP